MSQVFTVRQLNSRYGNKMKRIEALYITYDSFTTFVRLEYLILYLQGWKILRMLLSRFSLPLSTDAAVSAAMLASQ